MRVGAAVLALLLFTCVPTRAMAQAGPAEIAFWESVRDSKRAAELEAYLKAFPNGHFAPLARIRLNKLKAGGQAAQTEQPATSPGACGSRPCLRVTGSASDPPVGIHERPRAWAKALGKIPASANGVISLGETAISASVKWMQVEYRGIRGWVPAEFLEEVADDRPATPPPKAVPKTDDPAPPPQEGLGTLD